MFPGGAPGDSLGSSASSDFPPSFASFYSSHLSYFTRERHTGIGQFSQPSKWPALQQPRDRPGSSKLKTVCVCTALCLNLGVEPPDNEFPLSQSTGLAWISPTVLLANPGKGLESVGCSVQAQYEILQPKARQRLCLDPTSSDLRALVQGGRRVARQERLLFHYNGFGVPRPTSNGELWLFNRTFTQYIPLSLYELQSWIGGPAVYVLDCSGAGILVDAFNHFSQQPVDRVRLESVESMSVSVREESLSLASREEAGSVTGAPPSSEPPSFKDSILLAACRGEEKIPRHPDLPADLFTACLTTPLKVALRWFTINKENSSGATPLVRLSSPDLIDQIPGKAGDRKTPLGELNWIFTAITDTIAWHSLPRETFQQLFRGDLLLGNLFRNFLLAERIFKSFQCSPVSIPALPPCHKHFLWSCWDSVVESFLLQLDRFLKHSIKFSHSSFFAEHLSAFEVWLEVGRDESPPPLQLPIVLQVLLSQTHRRRALVLLARFLGKGSWAVSEALGVGILPYVLKLLQSPAAELREVLVFIWTKILSVARYCRSDLLKEGPHTIQYFLVHLGDSRVAERQRVMSAFVIAAILADCPEGQAAMLADSRALPVLVQALESDSPILRRWICLCIAKFWQGHESGKLAGLQAMLHERVASLVADPIPEVRAACLHCMACFMGRSDSRDRPGIELALARIFAPSFVDASPLVRLELLLALAALAEAQLEDFWEISQDRAEEAQNQRSLAIPQVHRAQTEPLSPQPPLSSRLSISSAQPAHTAIRVFLWRIVRALCHDPFPAVSRAALTLRREISSRSFGSRPGEFHSPSMIPNSPEAALMEGLSNMGLMEFSLADPLSPSTASGTPGNSAPSGNSLLQVPSSSSRHIKRNSSYGLFQVPPSPSTPSIPLRATSNDAPPSSFLGPEESSPVPSALPLSSIYERSCDYFAAPQQDPIRNPSEALSELLSSDWRTRRNSEIFQSAQALPSEVYDTQRFGQFDQSAVISCGLDSVSNLLLHPFENLLVAADSKRTISIWDYQLQERVNQFSNENPRGSKLTALHWINETRESLLLCGSDDGCVRIWKGAHEKDSQSLVSAFVAVRNLQRGQYPGLVLDWQPSSARLLASGNTDAIRVWDVEREICVAELGWGFEEAATFPTSLQAARDGHTLISGFLDGSVKMFDLRMSEAGGSACAALPRHSSPVVHVHLQRAGAFDGKFLSAALNREIHIVDLRHFRSSQPLSCVNRLAGFEKAIPLDCFACHDFAPIFAAGSRAQLLRIADHFGSTVSQLKYHKGFMGNRIGPVTALAFHPTKLILASASVNQYISILQGEDNQNSK